MQAADGYFPVRQNSSGLKSFKAWLEKHQVSFDENSLLVIENTGIYHRLIWNFCTTNLLPVFIGNAADLKWSFGIARTKMTRWTACVCVRSLQKS
ncbi:MAG: hypothetical protein IPL54_17850 [Chitinophagaceae bacterium]|nr:hypothetical protein [Chitinophagaceae bacterium]